MVQVAEVEEAARLGADAVVLFTALSGGSEPGMIRTLAGVGRECASLGMPLIAEAEFPTTYASVEELTEQYGFEYLQRNVRLCAELGADIVKTNWPGDADAFGRLVDAANGVPVVLADGSRLKDHQLLGRMEAAMAAGAIGCSVGRNIFMHASPEAITRALSRVIRERWTADKAATGARGRAGPGSGRMRAAFMTGVDAAEVRESRRSRPGSGRRDPSASRPAASVAPTPGRSSTAIPGPRRRGSSVTSRWESSSRSAPVRSFPRG